MPVTLGQMRERLSKLPHGAGVDAITLTGYINDRYMEYINGYSGWSRLRATSVIQTAAIYEDGTVSIDEGGTTGTGTATAFTLAMSGRQIRIDGGSEFYTFEYLTATTFSIDRPYEGDDLTDGGFRIFQNVYPLPSDLSVLESISVPFLDADLDQVEAEILDSYAPERIAYGRPTVYAPAGDSGGFLSQVELYPIPEDAEGLPVRYIRKVERLAASSEQFLPWINTEAIFSGVEADLYRLKGDGMAQACEMRFQMLLKSAVAQDVGRQAPMQIQMDERYTAHRAARARGGDREYRRWLALQNSD